MSADLKIIVVEDNELIREEMVSFLTRPGWRVHGVDCGESLSAWLLTHTPDIAVLDVNLPYEDGYSIAARLRESYPDTGLIMLTARVGRADRRNGYQAGADVFLTKPTNTDELIAVINNLGRRLHREVPRQLLLDRASGVLSLPGVADCVLTASELRLLELLSLAPEHQAESDFLIAELLKSERRIASRENLSVLVSRLRGKCQQTLGLDNLVSAHRGVGYRLRLPVEIR